MKSTHDLRRGLQSFAAIAAWVFAAMVESQWRSAHRFVHILSTHSSLLLWVDSVFVDLAAFHDEVYVLEGADVG